MYCKMIFEQKYSYSCLMCSTPLPIVKRLLSWSNNNVPDNKLVVNEEAGGREKDYHITVKYGLIESTPSEKLLEVLRNHPPFKVKIGKTSQFKNGLTKGFDVLKCEILSPELIKLNKLVCDSVKHVDTYAGYNPHLTIAYVKPNSCNHLENQYPLGDLNEFVIDRVMFSGNGDDSNKDRLKEVIKLYDMNYKGFFK